MRNNKIDEMKEFQFSPSREGGRGANAGKRAAADFNSRPRGRAVVIVVDEFIEPLDFNSRPRGRAVCKNGRNASRIFPYLSQSVAIKAGRTQNSRCPT